MNTKKGALMKHLLLTSIVTLTILFPGYEALATPPFEAEMCDLDEDEEEISIYADDPATSSREDICVPRACSRYFPCLTSELCRDSLTGMPYAPGVCEIRCEAQVNQRWQSCMNKFTR